MLTHFNIASNISQIMQVFMLDGRDKILGILPFFHSFGSCRLWLPAVHGVASYSTSIRWTRRPSARLLRSTTSHSSSPRHVFASLHAPLQTGELGSLQYVLVGAEKLQERVALAFEDQFGIRPLEGYGCTECSPIVAVNGKDFRAPGFRQVASRRGKIAIRCRRQRQNRRHRHGQPSRRAQRECCS